jgi:hypothetical protein
MDDNNPPSKTLKKRRPVSFIFIVCLEDGHIKCCIVTALLGLMSMIASLLHTEEEGAALFASEKRHQHEGSSRSSRKQKQQLPQHHVQ